MLTRIKRERQLTILVTTHYMDEADRLCDRIAIVDKGTLVALDTPRALKSSVPGASSIEAQFGDEPRDWEPKIAALPGTLSVQSLGGDSWRIVSDDAGRTTMALAELALGEGVGIRSLAVTSTSLDDVFVYYTGHGLKDSQAATARASAKSAA
jgi:ABC-2 type transport system ATP-binding protein